MRYPEPALRFEAQLDKPAPFEARILRLSNEGLAQAVEAQRFDKAIEEKLKGLEYGG